MPNNYILKDFDGGAQKTTVTAAMTNSATSFSVVDGSTFPPGSNPFVIVIDRGLATEEKILISSRVGNSFNVLERAYDGSSAQAHALGAVVEHVLDAFTVEQANRLANLQTTKGDLVAHDGSTTQRLGVGSNSTVLVADSTQTSGIKWAQIEANSISSGAIAAIASQVEALITPSGMPAGVITQFAGSVAPDGWLFCDGAVVSQTTEAALYAAIQGTYNTGGEGAGNFRLPNLKGKFPVGRDAADGSFDNLAETGGAKEVTLITANLPVHNHTFSSLTTTTNGAHTHNFTRTTLNDQAVVSAFADAFAADEADGSATTLSAGDHSHGISGASDNTGSGTAHQNLPPYIVLNYIIKK